MELTQDITKTPKPMNFEFSAPTTPLRPLVHTNKADMSLFGRMAALNEEYRKKLFQNYLVKEGAFVNITNISNTDGNILDPLSLQLDTDALRQLNNKKLTRDDLLKLIFIQLLRQKPVPGVTPDQLTELATIVRQLQTGYQEISEMEKERVAKEAFLELANISIDEEQPAASAHNDTAEKLDLLNQRVSDILDIMNDAMRMAHAASKDEEEVDYENMPLSQTLEQFQQRRDIGDPIPGVDDKVETLIQKVKEEEEPITTVEEKDDEPIRTSPVKTAKKDVQSKAAKNTSSSAPKASSSSSPKASSSSAPKKPMGKKAGKGITYYNNPADLVSKLEILIGEHQAGNNSKSVLNDIAAIADLLLKKKMLTKATYKTIYRTIGLSSLVGLTPVYASLIS